MPNETTTTSATTCTPSRLTTATTTSISQGVVVTTTEYGNPYAFRRTQTLPSNIYLHLYSPPGPSGLRSFPYALSVPKLPNLPFSYHLPPYLDPTKMPTTSNNDQETSQPHTPPSHIVFTDPSSMSALKTIETYSGGLELEAFLDNVAAVAECYRWTDIQVVNAIKLKLRGEAQTCFYALPADRRPMTVIGIRDWLMSVFGRKINETTAEREFYKIYRRKDESLRKYALRLEIAAAKMFPAVEFNEMLSLRNRIKRETVLIKQFFDGLETRLANEICRIRKFETIEEALPYAEHCEDVLARLYKETKADAHKSSVRVLTNKAVQEPRKNFANAAKPKREHTEAKTSPLRTDQKYPQMKDRCFNCGETGHSVRACNKQRQIFCYACVKLGHKATSKECPLNSNAVSAETQRQAV